ncbi:hypothetical protein PVAP13_4KG352088 [Panicum virgatum]|uniref:Uncharacterized protein n=1 Tax=Panicum virgatum TaxID=38727 RepID=A0A8T0TRB7_PANVG|nr:hypothetical protein PVAP13_4KG352088 [Panicum virgatum]
MARGQKRQQGRAQPSNMESRRNRASLARLVKLYPSLTGPQRKMIEEVNFDGLLKISCSTMPTGLASWLFVDCFDSERSELVFPGRGLLSQQKLLPTS